MATGDVTIGERYLELIREWPLRRLRSEQDLDRAVAMLDKLIDLGPDQRTAEDEEYMDVLGTLVEQYEDVHWPMPYDLELRGEANPLGESRLDPRDRADEP